MFRFHEIKTRKKRKGVLTKQPEVPATLRADSEMFPLEHLENTEIVLKGKYCLKFKVVFKRFLQIYLKEIEKHFRKYWRQ